MQFVTINGAESTKLEIKKGLSQGSILGPIFLNVRLSSPSYLRTTPLYLHLGENLEDLILFVNEEFRKV
jgi:hypothetical protein